MENYYSWINMTFQLCCRTEPISVEESPERNARVLGIILARVRRRGYKPLNDDTSRRVLHLATTVGIIQMRMSHEGVDPPAQRYIR